MCEKIANFLPKSFLVLLFIQDVARVCEDNKFKNIFSFAHALYALDLRHSFGVKRHLMSERVN